MSQQIHRIRRVTWLVRTSAQPDALRVRSALSAAWANALAGDFERACDEAAPADTVLRIPRLELHIQSAGAQEVGPMLAERVSVELAHQLRVAQSNATTSQRSGGAAAQVTTLSASAYDSLLHYLRTGSIVWTSSGQSSTETIFGLREAVRAHVHNVIGNLAASQSAAAWFRLLQLVDADYAQLLPEMRLLAGWSDAISDALRALLNAHSVEKDFTLHAGATLCVLASRAHGKVTLTNQLAEIVNAVNSSDRINARKKLGMLQAAIHSSRPEPVAVNDKPAPSLPSVARLSVASAGLILLHPFIATFLSRSGISTENGIDQHDLPRAAALLHHLATGRTEIFEFELGFIKVLLGLAPDTELPVAEGLLRDDDIAESDAMIRAVVQHWTALANTSVAGVRTSFLSRNGLLASEPHGWTLHVETSSFDMLLNRLPWAFAIVRLPWMAQPLQTQWTQ